MPQVGQTGRSAVLKEKSFTRSSFEELWRARQGSRGPSQRLRVVPDAKGNERGDGRREVQLRWCPREKGLQDSFARESSGRKDTRVKVGLAWQRDVL